MTNGYLFNIVRKMLSSHQFSSELQQHGTSSLLLPLFFTILASSFIIFFFKKPSPLNRKLPPSPPNFPIIGNLHQLGLHPHRSLRSLAHTHGPIMLLHLGSKPVLVISSAELARDVMKTQDLIFADRPITKIQMMLLYDKKDVAFASYGEYWRQIKSLCVLHLLSNKRVRSYSKIREEEINLIIDTLKNSSSSTSVVNLSDLIIKVTNNIVCRIAMGKKYNLVELGGRAFKEIFNDIADLLGSSDVGDYIPWLGWVNHVTGLYAKARKVAKEFDDFLENVVEEHIASGCYMKEDTTNKDFVDVLLWLQKENLAGFPIDRTCIKAITLDIFAGGTDTTYTLMEWVMTELLRHPEIMKRVQSEIREIAKDKIFISETDLNKLQYLKAVIKETFRMHPPVPLLVPRVARKDVKLQGYDIAAGTQVLINAFAIGRDAASWDQAEEFRPDRFLNSSIDFRGHDFELIPFGSGRRICPGIHFATITYELVLANLLYKFDWTLHGVAKGEDLDTTESTGISIHKRNPLFVVATPHI
ncbi:cytochrome P450 736A117-like [Mercurialis annua]|uniref:cytochrome P450 736A117-like n=1 Tax=Mercurialis annua TaxID=3986 RepID=UPI00216055A9|nr:cytochrome P450 736A117-like [Mercurialis annua]